MPTSSAKMHQGILYIQDTGRDGGRTIQLGSPLAPLAPLAPVSSVQCPVHGMLVASNLPFVSHHWMSNIITKSSLSSSILIRFVICLIDYDAAATFIVCWQNLNGPGLAAKMMVKMMMIVTMMMLMMMFIHDPVHFIEIFIVNTISFKLMSSCVFIFKHMHHDVNNTLWP